MKRVLVLLLLLASLLFLFGCPTFPFYSRSHRARPRQPPPPQRRAPRYSFEVQYEVRDAPVLDLEIVEE